MQTQTSYPWVFVLIMFTFFIPFSEIKAQEQKEENPKIEIKVNKQKDENGNIIRYDSSYSYSWRGENMSPAFIDSVFQNFKMNRDFDKFFGDDFFNEEFFGRDFFDERSDSVKPGIYERFRADPFSTFPDFDKLQEMMREHQENMMRYFKHFKDSRDSVIRINPPVQKQKNSMPKSKGRIIKT